ncbi:MAG: phosphotransferase enzyme family protein [Candidatus Kariarchaeaceae archaeon]
MSDSVLEEIVTRYNFDQASLKEIDTWENFIFEAKKSDIAYIIRIAHSSYRSIGQIKAEIDWIYFLKNEKMPVADPVLSVNNQFVEEVKVNDSSFFTTVFVKAPGDTIATNPSLMTPPVIEKWGGILGKFHKLTMKYIPQVSEKRGQWDSQPEIANIQDLLADHPKILEKAKIHIAYIRSLPQNKDTYGLIHYDLHEVNILVEGENLTVIDFDDSQYDYLVSDFGSIFFQLAWRFHNNERTREDVIREFYPQFMKGYLREYPLSDYWIERIPDFLKLRHFVLFCTLVVEEKIESTEWGKKIIDWWIPMLENDEPWIDFDFKLS